MAARASVTLFRHRIQDLIASRFIGRNPASGLATYEYANIGSARSEGVEVEAGWNAGAWMSGGLGYGFTDAVDGATRQPLPGRSPHTVKGRVSFLIPQTRSTVSAFGRYLARRPFADTNGDGGPDDYAPPLATVDVKVTQEIGRRLQAFLAVEDATDTAAARYTPWPGRRISFGLRLRYSR